MSSRLLAAMLLAVSTLSAASVRAQEAVSALPERLTLPVLLRLVAERSPRLAVEQVAIDTADDGRPYGIVSSEHPDAPHFTAVGTRFRLIGSGAEIGIPATAREALGVQPGDAVGYLPL